MYIFVMDSLKIVEKLDYSFLELSLKWKKKIQNVWIVERERGKCYWLSTVDESWDVILRSLLVLSYPSLVNCFWGGNLV